MKRYSNLWEEFISDENIDLAIHNAAKGKRKKRSVRIHLINPNFHEEIKKYALHFRNKRHTPREIYDGIQRKKRTIIVPTFEEQVIHHMVVNILKPIFMKSMYVHSYGSIPKRGPHKAKKYVERWIKGEDSKYCLKMDIRKYFDSISQIILLSKLRRIIKDYRFFAILEEIIRATEKGIPLGFYTSQWFANFYLTDLDHYIKEDLKAKHYIRYMDDMVIIDNDKEKLHNIRKEIQRYLRDNLDLELKNNYQVFLLHDIVDGEDIGRPLDFMGFRFYKNRIILRKTIMIKASRKAKKMNKNGLTIYSARQMLSYFGWLDNSNSYGFYTKYIKPYINFKELTKKISSYDRRQKNGELCMVPDGIVC